VLGKFGDEDMAAMPERKKIAGDAIASFMLAGLDITMNQYNNK
jgi:PTH1 family peptidyl-tRNA hydrolase